MNAQTYITYGIRDPRTGLYVYVGQTRSYEKRRRNHLKSHDARPHFKTPNIKTWIYDALAAGVIPEFVILETVNGEENSLISEFKWIRKLSLEKQPLLNKWKIHRQAMLSNNEEECLTTGVAALKAYLADKQVAERDYTNPELSHSKKPWLPSENKKLIELYAQGKGGNEIAELLCRPLRGVCARLVRLGVVPDRSSVRE